MVCRCWLDQFTRYSNTTTNVYYGTSYPGACSRERHDGSVTGRWTVFGKGGGNPALFLSRARPSDGAFVPDWLSECFQLFALVFSLLCFPPRPWHCPLTARLPPCAEAHRSPRLNSSARYSCFRTQAQAQVVAHPADLANFAQNMVVRRELARQAEVDGLHERPGGRGGAERSARTGAGRGRAGAGQRGRRRTRRRSSDWPAISTMRRRRSSPRPSRFVSSHILINAKACEAEARAREVLALARQAGSRLCDAREGEVRRSGQCGKGRRSGLLQSRQDGARPFESAAFALKQPGELSDVVKTEFGYHVIRLEERRPASRQPFEDCP